MTDDDICGSPFAVQSYTVHVDFGGDAALASLRQRLLERGIRLMLDFVPNHTALDHPWVQSHPEYYIHGSEADLAAQPGNYCRVASAGRPLILAHGRDPYFPGWPDTLQLNYRHAGFRQAMQAELLRIAGQCDAVRCDMAMLLLPEVIARTWGDRSLPADGSPPVDAPFWPAATALVRRQHGQFVFMAEVYWDLEWTLQQQGFDDTYDKRLYDRLHDRDTGMVGGHLHAAPDFQRKSVRFLENHDEPRAAAAFARDVHFAAATVAFLVPGLRFFHDGQFEGRKVRLSVHLARRPDEPVDAEIGAFYGKLRGVLSRAEVRDGDWQLLDCRTAWDGNPTWQHFLALSWRGAGGNRLLAVVNYGPTQGQCYVTLPFGDLAGRDWQLDDLLSAARYERAGDELCGRGLYLDMPAWGHQVFDVKSVTPSRPATTTVEPVGVLSRSRNGMPAIV